MEIKNLVCTVHKLSRSTDIQKLVTNTSYCRLQMTYIQRLHKCKLLVIPTETFIQSKFVKVFVNPPLPPTLWHKDVEGCSPSPPLMELIFLTI